MQNYKKMFDLTGRVALVVGAGSGIGRASAEAMGSLGARAVCADINAAAAKETARAIETAGGTAEAHELDLVDAEAVEALVSEVVSRHGRLDAAFTTPSINIRKRLFDYTREDFERIVGLNLGGTLNLLKSTGRVMAERESGSIIASSSMRAFTVEPGQGVYAATKAGTVQMVRALAAELGPRGVRVNCIAPGVIDTPLTAPIKNNPEWHDIYAAKTAFRRWGTATEVAGLVTFLACDASSYVTGSVLPVDGGWTAIDGRYDPPV